MKLLEGWQPEAYALVQALGLPRYTRSFSLNVTAGELVTLHVEHYEEGDPNTLVSNTYHLSYKATRLLTNPDRSGFVTEMQQYQLEKVKQCTHTA